MQTVLDIGVDVAKDQVVVACARQSFAAHSVANTAAGLRAWLKRLPAGSRIGVEATGGYHQCLADLAHKMGFVVYVLNPRDVRHYARAVGVRGKTDPVDAALIARYIAHEHARLHPYHPLSPEQRKLDRLLKRRAKLVSLKTALRLSLQDAPELRTELKATVQRFDALLRAIESQLAALIQQLFPTQRTRLQSIIGVGPVVGAGLAQALSRLPFANVQAFIAFIGLDPRPDDSGPRKGRRRLSKRGPAELRRLLFNAAMSAAKTPVWKPLYEHYRNRGWSTTATLVILARKIARIAYALWHGQSEFDPKRLATA